MIGHIPERGVDFLVDGRLPQISGMRVLHDIHYRRAGEDATDEAVNNPFYWGFDQS